VESVTCKICWSRQLRPVPAEWVHHRIVPPPLCPTVTSVIICFQHVLLRALLRGLPVQYQRSDVRVDRGDAAEPHQLLRRAGSSLSRRRRGERCGYWRRQRRRRWRRRLWGRKSEAHEGTGNRSCCSLALLGRRLPRDRDARHSRPRRRGQLMRQYSGREQRRAHCLDEAAATDMYTHTPSRSTLPC